MIHVAGIDSPGLAGSPAIAVDVVKMLEKDGLEMVPDPTFNPNRAPIILLQKRNARSQDGTRWKE